MTQTFKDINDNVLQIGDLVATTSAHYRDLVIAEIVGFTPKMIKIKNRQRPTFSEKYEKGYTLKDGGQVSLVFSRAAHDAEVAGLAKELEATRDRLHDARWALDAARTEAAEHDRRTRW